jgi:hypothetical protein
MLWGCEASSIERKYEKVDFVDKVDMMDGMD